MPTMYGCEIVWFSPIGSGWSPYARSRSASSTNRWRGIRRIASSTRGSVTPRRTSCSSTMRSRSRPARASCQPAPVPTARPPRHRPSAPFRPRDAPPVVPLPVLERAETRVVREIEHQRRHRHVAPVDGGVVRVLARLPRRRADADPEVAPPAGILPLDDLLAVEPPAEPRDPDAPRLARRHVHVQERDRPVRVPQQELRQPGGGPRGRTVARGRGRLDERHREPRHAQQHALEGGRHRARVRHVVTEVRAGVHARDDDPRPHRKEPEQREIHAVRRRAVHGEPPRPQLIRGERAMERQRVADGAPLAVGRHDPDLADRVERRRERRDAGRVDAVVVGDEDDGTIRLVHASGGPQRRRIYQPLDFGRSSAPPGAEPGSIFAAGVAGVEWSGRLDLNQRPLAPHASALPGCATPRTPRIVRRAPAGFKGKFVAASAGSPPAGRESCGERRVSEGPEPAARAAGCAADPPAAGVSSPPRG